MKSYLLKLNKIFNEQTKVIRYTDRKGQGLLNHSAYNMDKLNDDDANELQELLGYGLQQPSNVPDNAIFFFTQEGEKQHSQLLSLLKKAARFGVVRKEFIVSGNPIWESEDGQVAYLPDQIENERSPFKKY